MGGNSPLVRHMGAVAFDTKFERVDASAGADAPRLLRFALWLVAGLTVSGWLALAAIHLRDDYRMTHTHGVWIAAAEAARTGSLYPAIFDGEHYAGTRYMPVPILLNAAASAVAGDPVAGGKALAAALMAILLVLAVVVLRGMSCPWPIAVALAAGVVATQTGLEAGTTIGGDLLPAVLQLGALSLALRRQTVESMAGAGILAGLAIASKLTGSWGFLAVVTWLALRRQWRPAAVFATTALAGATAVLGTVQVVTDGGLFEHLRTFSAAGVQNLAGIVRAPNKLLYQLTTHASGTVVLLPLAIFAALWGRRWRDQSILLIALGFASLLLLVVYADVGTGSNQLLDLVLLVALAVGVVAASAASSRDMLTGRTVLLAVALTVTWSAGIDLVRTVGRDLALSVAGVRTGERAAPVGQVVAAMVGPNERVLTADPSIDVALGRRPLVMDPFMLVRLDRTHPEWVDPLIARIERREFDVVVMVVRLENPEVDFWWTDYHFGPRVARALRSAYRLDGKAGRYHLYRPRTSTD
jgi:hypothetical protein